MNEPVNLGNPITEWEKPIWTPMPLFKGETVFCAGCGPSLTPEIAAKLRGRRVVAVNSAVYLLPFADVLFFTDSGWFEAYNEADESKRGGGKVDLFGHVGNDVWPRRQFVEDFPGLVVTFSPVAKRVLDDPRNPYKMARRPRVQRIKACGAATATPMRAGQFGFEPGFPVPIQLAPEIWGGRSSGHSAIALAIAMGAARIGLVGYDMRVVGGREHFHNDYTDRRNLDQYQDEFLPGFRGWNAAARANDVEVLNCTEGSAISEFEFAGLDDLLAR